MLTYKIKEIRREKGLTQTHMAQSLNVSQAAYQKMETGQIRLKKTVLDEIASVFGMSIDEIDAYNLPQMRNIVTPQEQTSLSEVIRFIDPTLKELIQSYKSRIEYLEKENMMLLQKIMH